MIASRYLTQPVLFYRPDLAAKVKFDIRYMVLLHSVRPLKLYAYKVTNGPYTKQGHDLDKLK
jgi:tubulin--tyrosine ligase-like protein 12